jgi:hypothetical protein
VSNYSAEVEGAKRPVQAAQFKREFAMPVLTWKHRTTSVIAKSAIQAELTRLGHADAVAWNNFEATARVGFGAVLNAKGVITYGEIIVEKSGGALGGSVLGKCNELLERLFPGGKVLI